MYPALVRRTLFLMAEPSFWYGPARILDLFGRLDQFNISPTPQEADARAIAADWVAVGDELWAAMEAADPDAPSRDVEALVR